MVCPRPTSEGVTEGRRLGRYGDRQRRTVVDLAAAEQALRFGERADARDWQARQGRCLAFGMYQSGLQHLLR